MSNNENNNGFENQQPHAEPQGNNTSNNGDSVPNGSSYNSYSGNYQSNNNPNSNNNHNGSWVFSEQQHNPQNTGYNSKYSYSSYENAQSHSQNRSTEAQRQNSGPAFDHSAYHKQEEPYRWNYEDYQSQQPSEAKKSKKHRGLKIFAGILGGIACVGILTLAGFGVVSLLEGNHAKVEEVSPPNAEVSNETTTEHSLTITDRPEEETEILTDGKLTIPQRAEKVKASVVGIVNYQQGSNSYFSTAESQGSGIIMSEDGFIITNAHVIENAMGLKVVLADGTEYSAQIIGSDSQTDLAVIKIDATGLTPAEFGNSNQLQVGEQLIAVGNPTGLQLGGTLTVGYVSALNRQIDGSNGLNYIQTDAAINPGNSGGALANEYGQVIGINTAKITGEDIEGLGFAISINDAQPIIDDLLNYGYVKGRVRIGISVYEIDAFTAQLNNIPRGLMVGSIEPGTPAASSGLMTNDIITAIDGQEVYLFDNVSSMLDGKKPGDTVVLSVFRRTTGLADKELTIEVGLIESVETPVQVQNGYNNQSSENGTVPFRNYFGSN
ncbi:MAG: trypsin-like peptidase domain-containing protein [Oscillospiraceae bacterium]|nr:trypsin-like peptidase domain-containing protein [Oscillospiraceae bacterium]